jgi:hypothetical protein
MQTEETFEAEGDMKMCFDMMLDEIVVDLVVNKIELYTQPHYAQHGREAPWGDSSSRMA